MPIETNSPWLSGVGLGQTIRQELHANTEDLAKAEKMLVQGRTIVLKGALVMDVWSEAHHDVNDPVLVEIASDTEHQLATWNRIYVEYQEGGVLGLSTYTNPPHEMFGKILTDDLFLIQAWADEQVDNAIERVV